MSIFGMNLVPSWANEVKLFHYNWTWAEEIILDYFTTQELSTTSAKISAFNSYLLCGFAFTAMSDKLQARGFLNLINTETAIQKAIDLENLFRLDRTYMQTLKKGKRSTIDVIRYMRRNCDGGKLKELPAPYKDKIQEIALALALAWKILRKEVEASNQFAAEFENFWIMSAKEKQVVMAHPQFKKYEETYKAHNFHRFQKHIQDINLVVENMIVFTLKGPETIAVLIADTKKDMEALLSMSHKDDFQEFKNKMLVKLESTCRRLIFLAQEQNSTNSKFKEHAKELKLVKNILRKIATNDLHSSDVDALFGSDNSMNID